MKKKILLLIIMLFMPFIVVQATDGGTDWNEDILISPSPYVEESGSEFLAGEDYTSDKVVNGILFAAGNNISINGSNEYGMYAGNYVTMGATIEKDLFAAGNVIEINSSAIIGRDAYAAGNKIKVSGNVFGDMKLYGRTIELSNVRINGNVYLGCETIKIGENVIIEGTVKYNDDAVVLGAFDSTILVDTYKATNYEDHGNYTRRSLLDEIVAITSLIIVALVLNALFPKINKSLDKKITAKKTFANMGIGFALLILLPIASVIAMVTGVGLGIGFLTLALYVIALCLSIIPVMVIIGENLLTSVFKLKSNQYLSIMVGVIVVKLVSYIPVLGGVVYFLLVLVGLGYIKELMFPKKDTTKK